MVPFNTSLASCLNPKKVAPFSRGDFNEPFPHVFCLRVRLRDVFTWPYLHLEEDKSGARSFSTSQPITNTMRLLLLFAIVAAISGKPFSNWPRREKTCLRDLRTTKAQTSLRIRAV